MTKTIEQIVEEVEATIPFEERRSLQGYAKVLCHRVLAAYLAEHSEPAYTGVDTNWLHAVLRFADKNPDYFPDIEEGKYGLDGSDAEIIATLCQLPVGNG